jgi:glycosyltransferase involved in cell wall biosynthesis
MSPSTIRVLRLCSVFGAPDAAVTGRGVRFDPIGGMQSHTGQLTRALAERGVEQVVVTTRPPGAPRRLRSGGTTVLRHGLPVPWGRQMWAGPAARSALREAASADLVHAHAGEDIAVLPVALAAARRASVPIVVTVHTSVGHTYVPAGPRGWALKLLGGAAESGVLRRADGVIVLTPRLAGLLTDAGIARERLHVLPSGVDLRRHRTPGPDPFPGSGRPRVVFVGRLHRQKGIGTLIEAAAALRTPDVEILVVGDGPERGAAEEAARRLGLEGRVRFTGFRPHAQIPAVLAHADVFAMPSLYEELGSVLIEAMAAGLPIVASRTGGIPDAVGDAAELVPPGDPQALAAAIDGLLADRAAAGRLAEAARRRASRYDWAELADGVLDVYRGVLTPDAPPMPPGRRPALAQRIA